MTSNTVPLSKQSSASTQILQDIKELQQKKGEISVDATLQVIMTTLITINTNIEKLGDDLECNVESNTTFQKDITNRVDALSNNLMGVAGELKTNKDKLEIISKSTENWCLPNPVVQFGCFMKTHPKGFVALVTLGIFISLLLNIPEVKHSIIIFMGFPTEFANFIAPLP